MFVCCRIPADGPAGPEERTVCVKQDYDECTDEELIGLLRDGGQDIMDYILEKYKGMVKAKARSMYLLGGDSEDLIQEGMIGLFKAVRDYDCGRDAGFATFAELCVSRQMYTAVQASTRKKHMPLNTYISLYQSGTEGEQSENVQLLNALAPENQMSPEDRVIDRENVEALELAIETELSAFEKQVLDLYMTGMSYSQIARVLGRDEKSTDNALSRVRSKLRRAIGHE